MSLHKTYHIATREQGKASQRDQSYRSCLTALLIFFFLCLILIIACKPWAAENESYKNYVYEHYQGKQTEKAPTIMTTFLSTRATPTTISTASTEDTTTANFDVVTEDHSKTNVKEVRPADRYSENTTMQNTTVKDTEDYNTSGKNREENRHTEATREHTDAATTRYNIIDNITDSGTISMSPTIAATMLKNNVTIVDIIEQITTSMSIKNATDEKYNLQTSTVPTQSDDGEKTTTEKYTNNFERLRFYNVTDNNTATSSTISTHSTDIQESSSTREKSDSTMSNIGISLTTPIRSDFEANKYTTASITNKDLTYDEFINTTDNITSSTTIQLIPVADTNIRTHTFTNEHLNAEFTTMINETSTQSYDHKTTGIHIIYNKTSDTTEKYNTFSTTEFLNARTTSDFYNRTTITTISPTTHTTDSMTTTALDDDLNVCETGRCKQITSRMLSYMNHSADPCDDFYEYACGGFEADPQIMDKELVQRSKTHQRIATQMLKEKNKNVYSSFTTYYNSCMRYENDVNITERIRIANDMLKEMGKFYINATWPDNYAGITNLFAKLILHHSAFLFDIVPELDEYRPNSLTLKIGPTIYESPFNTEYMENPECSEDKFNREEQYVNLRVLYENYKRCKKDTEKLERSIEEALISLNVFTNVNNSYLDPSLRVEHIKKTVHVIDSVIMKGYFSHFPPKSQIQKAYSMSNYRNMNLEELQSSSKFLNWTQLIGLLTTVDVSNKNIQVYFHDALTKGLREMEEFAEEDSIGLNNALMGLYAHKLYNEMVLSSRDNIKDHCLEVAIYLMRLEASSLYISSFTDNEILRMNSITRNMFEQLKKTLKLKTSEAKWAMDKGQERLLRKIDSLELALPDISYFKNRDSLNSENDTDQINLSDNYFNNSIILLKRYRTLMYAELGRQVDVSKQIWTYFATPFQSKARSIYSLNLIVVPYGIADWSLMNDESFLSSLHYLLLANLGISIAYQIACHFDANGVHYWNQTRNTEFSLMHEHKNTNMHFNEYVDCHKKNMYQTSMNMTLPFTDQTVSFTIPQLTLNERLSDIMGFRLAYDTLALNRSNAEARLPWINLRIDQLFYLTYAQTYCTKTPLTSSFVTLYESESLPSRIRVFVTISNNELVADAWNCRTGSQIKPVDVCSVFPYIESKVFDIPIAV